MGPSVDSVLGIDVVSTWENDTADWDIVRINATSYPDLFWGMLVSTLCQATLSSHTDTKKLITSCMQTALLA